MNAIPAVPRYPNGISGAGTRCIVSYAGTPRWEIPEKLARARQHHAAALAKARAAREAGLPWLVARRLRDAAWTRTTIEILLREQRALDTIWAERQWYPYAEYEARRAQLIAEGRLRS